MAGNQLEKRLWKVGYTEKQVKNALTERHIIPAIHKEEMPYLEYNLTDAIANFLFRPQLSKKLYNSHLNKEPLKRVWYGMLSTGKLSEDFLKALTDWEAVYFFAGRWELKNPDLTALLNVLTAEHLLSGIENVYKVHNYFVNTGKYSSKLELPEGKNIYRNSRDIIERYDSKNEQLEMF